MNDQERQRYATVGSAFLGKVAQRLTTLRPEDMTASDVARWTEVAVKLQQLGQERIPYDREERERQQLRPPPTDTDWLQTESKGPLPAG